MCLSSCFLMDLRSTFLLYLSMCCLMDLSIWCLMDLSFCCLGEYYRQRLSWWGMKRGGRLAPGMVTPSTRWSYYNRLHGTWEPASGSYIVLTHFHFRPLGTNGLMWPLMNFMPIVMLLRTIWRWKLVGTPSLVLQLPHVNMLVCTAFSCLLASIL